MATLLWGVSTGTSNLIGTGCLNMKTSEEDIHGHLLGVQQWLEDCSASIRTSLSDSELTTMGLTSGVRRIWSSPSRPGCAAAFWRSSPAATWATSSARGHLTSGG